MLLVEVFLKFRKLVKVPVSFAQSVAWIAEFSRWRRAIAASTESRSTAAITVKKKKPTNISIVRSSITVTHGVRLDRLPQQTETLKIPISVYYHLP